MNVMERKSFLDLPAPPNYVAGIGRGATGFTTRSDLGAPKLNLNQEGSDDEEEDNYAENGEKGLLNVKSNDKDDEEADRIYELIERRLQSRGKKRIGEDERQESLKRQRQEDDKNGMENISNQFADLKKQLGTISEDQWLNLPEASDFTKRNKRERELAKQQRRTYNVSDSLLAGLRDQGAVDTTVDAIEDAETNFELISSARGKLLSSKLGGDSALDESLTTPIGQFDAKDYLNQLESMNETQRQTSAVGDLAKSRAIFKSLRTTEPNNPIHWISSARIEVQARKMDQAKRIIQQGCKRCLNDEGIWLENISINSSDVSQCKAIVTEALTFNLKSEKLWLKAIELENDVFSKKKIVKKALQNKSDSINLWRVAINLEDDKNDAKALLTTAVELIPNSAELWLALIHLEDDVKACKKILNQARKKLPLSHEIWIEAGKLEEQSGLSLDKISKLLRKGITDVVAKGNTLARDTWLQEAIKCETQGYSLTAMAIANGSLDLYLDDKDDIEKIIVWQEDVEKAILAHSLRVAKCIYKYIIERYPQELPVWKQYFEFLKTHGNSVEELYSAYQDSIKHNPSTEQLWLRYAKDKWVNGDIENARSILSDAFNKNPTSAEIWLAAIKLESSTRNYKKALDLLESARNKLEDDARMWYKSVTFERQLGNHIKALELVNEALNRFPLVDKLHMQKGQIFQDLNNISNAREAYNSGVRLCGRSIPLWILLAETFIQEKNVIRARSVLDRAVIENPENDDLWVAKINLEKRLDNFAEAKVLVNKAFQKFPHSAKIWSEKLGFVEKKTEMKKHLVEAMKQTNSDPLILLTIGVNFYIDGKHDKAKVWFERSINQNKDYGDTWCWMYIFLKKRGKEKELADLIKDFKIAEPKHGIVWSSVNKDVKNFEKPVEELLEIASRKLLSGKKS